MINNINQFGKNVNSIKASLKSFYDKLEKLGIVIYKERNIKNLDLLANEIANRLGYAHFSNEENLLKSQITFSNEIKQVFSDSVINLVEGDNAKLIYTINDSFEQSIDVVVNNINGTLFIGKFALLGDEDDYVNLSFFLNTKDLINIGNGSVAFIETNGIYSNDMPKITIHSIEKK